MSAGNFSSKTKNEFSQSVETASRFTRDAVTTTLVTGLYLMRRSLEVLRKFHWMILGGRFNQLSHVSSPLLSKPREYRFGGIKSLLSAVEVTAASYEVTTGVLNPGEFELWKMRIEQYFLMTNYALWEVILNGDSPLPTRTVDGVETSVPPTTAE
ncbi:hypothetical protein Tco_0472347 [Tanacetum coccineum]